MKMLCPHTGKKCLGEQCAGRVKHTVTDKTNGNVLREVWLCPLQATPIMLVDILNAVTANSQGMQAAVESFRNQMTKHNEEFWALVKARSESPRLPEKNVIVIEGGEHGEEKD